MFGYSAPEELEQHSIERAEYPKNIDPSLSECYSIGLCMLAAGTLEDVDSIYSWEQGEKKIHRHKVNYYLKLFGEKYSSFLHSLVMGLLADNPLDRKRCSEIYSTLYEYEDKILDLESFLPTSSRLAPFPQQPQQLTLPHPVIHSRPIFHEQQLAHNRLTHPNPYFHPNGVVVNPIESKYIPVSPMHSQSGFRQSAGFALEDSVGRMQGFRPNSGPNFVYQR